MSDQLRKKTEPDRATTVDAYVADPVIVAAIREARAKGKQDALRAVEGAIGQTAVTVSAEALRAFIARATPGHGTSYLMGGGDNILCFRGVELGPSHPYDGPDREPTEDEQRTARRSRTVYELVNAAMEDKRR